ncbi:hypothetical protein [Streptomyces sp. NPDC002671]
MITHRGHPTSTLPPPGGLEELQRNYMLQIIAAIAARGSQVRVAPYVLAHTMDERNTDLALIKSYAVEEMGWQVTKASFADAGQAPPLERRRGFASAWRYAMQGYADGHPRHRPAGHHDRPGRLRARTREPRRASPVPRVPAHRKRQRAPA